MVILSSGRRSRYPWRAQRAWLRIISAVLGACAVIAVGIMTAALHEGEPSFGITKAVHVMTPTTSERRPAS